MTDKPTPEQIQRACDLLNASVESGPIWKPLSYGHHVAFTALADTIAQLDAKDAMIDGQAALIATLTAERDKATADLARIAEIAGQRDASWSEDRLGYRTRAVFDIAAPYRVETDPLESLMIEAEAELFARFGGSGSSYREIISASVQRGAELAKRGLEIGRSA